ncbi:uncharacterized protein LOC131932206 [Physella acuta]|uniref:uncharacterized protein LOC131932206 n=1 Tax=Physella acuta TaxID=109671 RepID=UPI0027DC2656|nr:uncharacterized protein LOC131932206 [Physella acuta]
MSGYTTVSTTVSPTRTWLLTLALFISLSHRSIEVEDCPQKEKKCKEKYTQDIEAPFNEHQNEKSCRVFNEFRWCVMDLEHCLSDKVKDELIHEYQSDLQSYGVECAKEAKPPVTTEPRNECTDAVSRCNKRLLYDLRELSGPGQEHEDKIYCGIKTKYRDCLLEITSCKDKSKINHLISLKEEEFSKKSISCSDAASMPGYNTYNGCVMVTGSRTVTVSVIVFFWGLL